MSYWPFPRSADGPPQDPTVVEPNGHEDAEGIEIIHCFFVSYHGSGVQVVTHHTYAHVVQFTISPPRTQQGRHHDTRWQRPSASKKSPSWITMSVTSIVWQTYLRQTALESTRGNLQRPASMFGLPCLINQMAMVIRSWTSARRSTKHRLGAPSIMSSLHIGRLRQKSTCGSFRVAV